MANECDDKTLRAIKAKEVFYQVRGIEGRGGRGGGRGRDEGRERGRRGRRREGERERERGRERDGGWGGGREKTKIMCTFCVSEWSVKGW